MARDLPERPRGKLSRGLKGLGAQAKRQPTPAERILWWQLRDSRLDGYKFRQQYRVENYRVDFYCAARKLVVELDGPIHEKQGSEDAERQQHLEQLGYRFMRFKNDQLTLNLPEVLTKIRDALDLSTA